MKIIKKFNRVIYIYKNVDKQFLKSSIKNVKRDYGIKGVITAVKNKANGRPMLYGLNNHEDSKNVLWNIDGKHIDDIGNEIFMSQQEEYHKDEIRQQIANLEYHPLISIIMPIYNPPVKWLEKAVECLLNQYYENWELCAVDDGSLDKRGLALLEKYTEKDKRIRTKRLLKNGGISITSNEALNMAKGEYIALVDQDDEITNDALFWIAREINLNRNADLIYTDECKIGCSNNARKSDFYFKPDWSPTLLINHMYIGHLAVYRKILIQDIGGFRKTHDFSQDYDLALRVSQKTKNIYHVERILYFWRTLPSSGAAGGKDFARISNLHAMVDWYRRAGLKVVPEKKDYANYGSLILKENPLVSIIIPTDSVENLENAIDGILLKTSYKNYEIVAVTNSKTAMQIEEKYPYLELLKICHYNKVYNFSEKCNEGAILATGEILIFYNDDVVPYSKDWIERQIEILNYPDIGGVSPLLLYENNTIQYAGMITGTPGLVGTAFNGIPFITNINVPYHHLLLRDVSVLSGACTVIRKNIFVQIHGFDAENTPNGHSDVDLSFKLLEQGLRCVYTPYAVLTHIGNHSWHAVDKKDKSDLFCLKRWGKYISQDPYFTSNMKKVLYKDFRYTFEIKIPKLLKNKQNQNAKDVLLITHELSRTGAPVVLKSMVDIILQNGDFPIVLSPMDGPLRQEFLDMGVIVIIDESFIHGHWMFERFARNFDIVVVNTIACGNAVRLLKDSLPKVIWWIHEGSYALECFKNSMPLDLGDNINVYSISNYTTEIFKSNGFRYQFNELRWGLQDYAIKYNIDDYKANSKVTFMIVGSIESRKGQDLVIQAIKLLEAEQMKECEFIFIGRVLEKSLANQIVEASNKFNCIRFLDAIPQEAIFKLYPNIDCVIVPSRDEPMSLVAVESMIFSKVLIVSDTTGIAEFIMNDENGLIFQSESINQIAEKIRFILNNRDLMKQIGQNARKTYEEYFSFEKYRNDVQEIMK